jgi:hypothetical protein
MLINSYPGIWPLVGISGLTAGKNCVPFVQHAPENSSENLWGCRFFIAWQIGFDNVGVRRRGEFPGSPRLVVPKGTRPKKEDRVVHGD